VLADFQNIFFESLPLDGCGNDVGSQLQKMQPVGQAFNRPDSRPNASAGEKLCPLKRKTIP
jgi:hypothetical protein